MKIKRIMKKIWVRILLILLMPPLVLIAACMGLLTYDNYCKTILFPPGGWGFSHDPNTNPVALIPSETSHIQPRWTPDGSQVVFSTFYIDAGAGAYVASSDGSTLSPIDGSSLSPIGGVSLSPDGSRVAYFPDDDIEISTVDSISISTIDASSRREINVDDARGPSVWSPDDSSLAFLRHDDRSFAIIGCPDIRWRDEVVQGIYAANVDDVGGSDIREIARWKAFVRRGESETMDYRGGLSWSPDGRFLAFVGERMMRNEEGIIEQDSLQSVLYTVRANGSELRELFTVSGGNRIAGSLAWSPDSRRIAFMVYPDTPLYDTGYLYTIDIDGSDLRELVVINQLLDKLSSSSIGRVQYNGYPGSIDWSPDGSRILFSLVPSFLSSIYRSDSSSSYWELPRLGALYITDVDGIGVHSIGDGMYASWSPDGSVIANLMPFGSSVVLSTVAPDGTDVRALVRRSWESGFFDAVGPEQRPSATVASCSAGVVVADPNANHALVRDCEALVKMIDRRAVVGLNWNADTPINEWVGVSSDDPSDDTDSSPSRVRGLSLSEMSRLGAFQDELTKLTGLRILDLSSTGLHGEIPSELGNLSSLRELNLSWNDLGGGIPSELGNLSTLEFLDLSWNDLGGEIPSELGNLSALEFLDLDQNGLSGPIPSELGNLSALEFLDLSGNNLSGPIPSELGNLSSLEILDLKANFTIDGWIPSELGNLSSLRELYLDGNNISGPIPAELGNLSALERLDLGRGDGLAGCIPSALAEPLRAGRALRLLSSYLPYCEE